MTAKELNKLKKSLPTKWAEILKKALKDKISTRQIQRIVYGECEDNHGVLKKAVKLAAVHKQERAKLSRSINKI